MGEPRLLRIRLRRVVVVLGQHSLPAIAVVCLPPALLLWHLLQTVHVCMRVSDVPDAGRGAECTATSCSLQGSLVMYICLTLFFSPRLSALCFHMLMQPTAVAAVATEYQTEVGFPAAGVCVPAAAVGHACR